MGGVGARAAGGVHLRERPVALMGFMVLQGEDLIGKLLRVSLGTQLSERIFLLEQAEGFVNPLNRPQH